MGNMFEVQSTGWHFTMVPNSVLFAAELSTTQKCVFVALCSFMDSNGSGAYPSYRKVAERASCSKRAAIAAINNLVNRGYVIKDYRINDYGEQTSNIYKVVTDAPGGETVAPGVVNEVHPGGETVAPKREPFNESHSNESARTGKADAKHTTLNVPINQTRYDNLCNTYSQPIIDSYIQRAIDYCDSKGKRYYKDFAAAASQYIARDERDGKGPEKSKPREVCSSCGRPRVGTEGSCMYCIDGQFVEAS